MNSFLSKMRAAALQNGTAKNLVWVGNFEVEGDWKEAGTLSLPGLSSRNTFLINNSLAEMALLLADAQDIVLLKKAPDPDYLDYLQQLGLPLPSIYTAAAGDPLLRLTPSLLQDNELLAVLQERASSGQYHIFPHGISPFEEELSRQTGIPLAAVSSQVASRINSKVYSRQLCEHLGINQVNGVVVHTLPELEQAFQAKKTWLADSPLVLKDGLGVSGKGMLLIDSEKRFEQVLRMMRSAARKAGHERIEMVLEEWVRKEKDINYSFLIAKNGQIEMGYILEALVEKGVHLGHLHPHTLPGHVVEEIYATIPLLAKELWNEGYFGVVGVDAMLTEDGTFYPCIEINARLNMSSYHARIFAEWLSPGSIVIARSFSFRKTSPLSFSRLRTALGDLLYSRETGVGVLINGFSAVNLEEKQEGPTSSRLYAMLVGTSLEHCLGMQESLQGRLGQIDGVLVDLDA